MLGVIFVLGTLFLFGSMIYNIIRLCLPSREEYMATSKIYKMWNFFLNLRAIIFIVLLVVAIFGVAMGSSLDGYYYTNITEDYTVEELLKSSVENIKFEDRQNGVTIVTGIVYRWNTKTRFKSVLTYGNPSYIELDGNRLDTLDMYENFHNLLTSGYNKLTKPVKFTDTSFQFKGVQLLGGDSQVIGNSILSVERNGKVLYDNMNIGFIKKNKNTSVNVFVTYMDERDGAEFAVLEFDPEDYGSNYTLTVYGIEQSKPYKIGEIVGDMTQGVHFKERIINIGSGYAVDQYEVYHNKLEKLKTGWE